MHYFVFPYGQSITFDIKKPELLDILTKLLTPYVQVEGDYPTADLYMEVLFNAHTYHPGKHMELRDLINSIFFEKVCDIGDWVIDTDFDQTSLFYRQGKLQIELQDGKFETVYQLYQVIRSIYVELLLKYSVEFHGAAIQINNKGVLILGEKFAGKTTMMLKLLQMSQQNDVNRYFISNDDIYIDDNQVAWGNSRSVSIRQITFDNLKLNKPVTQYIHKPQTRDEYWKNKYRFLPSEIVNEFSAKLHNRMKINIVVILKYGSARTLKLVFDEKQSILHHVTQDYVGNKTRVIKRLVNDAKIIEITTNQKNIVSDVEMFYQQFLF
ncbi:hypothetical protein WFA24289_01872 [Periweissella fabaria]|uniref:HPr kinase n=1 Tax=Periweissella fabaria TaxID=546157 RepID=A0ABN8BMM6_9LACO|nr:hypothetical protein [Periweissella fabaria]CAH0417530.1 hypothetical protein WFA24289_01872 [Periweissella fabaria]